MSTIQIAKRDGGKASLDCTVIESLGSAIRGTLLQPGDSGYDEARTIWNAMIDRKPALIARCTGAADVSKAVSFAAEHGLLTAIRGGGHNIAGNAVCEGGFMIDLSLMKSVWIDPGSRKAHVGPGATLGDVDHETQAFGLALPVGINSTTGVAGLVLGGGFGWLSRKHGLTSDNLTAAEVVTADGSIVRASESENPDLFWAIRGGGGNFGVVTRFEFDLYPVGPDLLSGLIVFSLKEGASVMKAYRKYVDGLSDDTSVCHAGDPEEGRRALEPIRSFGTVLGEHVGVQPFTAWQQAFDPLLTPGARNYWKSHNFTEINDETIEALISYANKLPSPHCEIFFGMLAGAVNRVDPTATAYAHRDAKFVLNVHGRWETEAEDSTCIKWARDFFNVTAPHASSGVYVNFMTEEEKDRIQSAFGVNYERLAETKMQYDPDNLFSMNQNIPPAKSKRKAEKVRQA